MSDTAELTVSDTARTYPMTIGGRAAAGGATSTIYNPATAAVVGLAPQATTADLDAAVEAARAAFPAWRDTPDDERKAACHRIADVIEANAAELAELITRETGKTQSGMGANFEIGGAVAWSRATAETSLSNKRIRDDANSAIELRYEPIGVVGSITPWNWPLLIAVWHILPAVRTGNAIVVKPSPFAPLNTLRLIELINTVVPPGVVNVVSGGDELGAAVSGHPGIGKIVFTGSIATGRNIMRSAADGLKRLTLELGGNDAGIVLPGTDPAPLVEKMFWGAFLNSGQTCAALKRLYVHRDDYEKVAAALVEYSKGVPMGDGMDAQNLLGPLQNKPQIDKVERLVEEAKADGARVLSGGERPGGPGLFYPITFLADVHAGQGIVDQEQFGPVLPIIAYDDLDEAIASANSLEFGLSASVWGQDQALAEKVADRLEAGTVFINKHAEIAPDTPLGGIKASGVGVEFGEEGLREYMNIKIINSAPAA